MFVGDSRIRQIYKSLVRQISSGSEPEEYWKETEKEHHALSFEKNNVSISFHWAPEPKNIIYTVSKSSRRKILK